MAFYHACHCLALPGIASVFYRSKTGASPCAACRGAGGHRSDHRAGAIRRAAHPAGGRAPHRCVRGPRRARRGGYRRPVRAAACAAHRHAGAVSARGRPGHHAAGHQPGELRLPRQLPQGRQPADDPAAVGGAGGERGAGGGGVSQQRGEARRAGAARRTGGPRRHARAEDIRGRGGALRSRSRPRLWRRAGRCPRTRPRRGTRRSSRRRWCRCRWWRRSSSRGWARWRTRR